MSDKPKVMVVDDNPMNLEVLAEAFEDLYDVVTAEDGSFALSLAASFLPDVVLLDVMMPGRDGFDVCRCIKQDYSLREARIIMVSARAELASRLKGYDAGADDYVTKPFDEEELLTKVDFALRTKRLQGLCGATGEVLALVSELRDTEFDPDMESVREVATGLANTLARGSYADQIDRQFLDDLHQASALRDVGILAVPAAVRDKPTILTNEEHEQLKQHTLVGAALLERLSGEHRGISVFKMATDVARSHHERYDGGGYPHGLSGNNIPLAARIVSVAEAIVDAVEHADEAHSVRFDGILGDDGSHFDPVVIQAAEELIATCGVATSTTSEA